MAGDAWASLLSRLSPIQSMKSDENYDEGSCSMDGWMDEYRFP